MSAPYRERLCPAMHLHPGGRAFLFTVSNSVVSSFPRRVVAPGFCFSLPPPDEGRRSAEKARGLARPPGTCCEHVPGRVRGARAPLRSGTLDSRRSTGGFVVRFRASLPCQCLLGILQRAPRKKGRTARTAVSAPPEATLRAPPRERRPRSTFRNASGRRPL